MHSVSEGEYLLEEEARCNSLMSAAATAAGGLVGNSVTGGTTVPVWIVSSVTCDATGVGKHGLQECSF